jgi:hypothetical protein
MAPSDNNREAPLSLIRRVTKGVPIGRHRDESPTLPPAPQVPAQATETGPAQTPTPDVGIETALHPRAAFRPAPASQAPADAPKQEVVDASVARMLPPVSTRPASEISALTALLQAMVQGGEPLGPLVMPTRDEEVEEERPAKKKAKTKGGTTSATSAGEANADPSARKWPSGPLVGRELFAPDEVQRLIEAILMDEDIMDHATMPGLTRARLREVGRAAGFEPNRFGRFSAPLIVWFARAGVTVLEDDKARNPWARPRPIASRDRAEIRRMLRDTDPPDGDAVAIARAAGLDSSAP